VASVVLIQPHASFAVGGCPTLGTQFDSLGLLALSAYLKAHGFPTRVLHMARAMAFGIRQRDVFDWIERQDPLFVGLSMNWLHLSVGAIEAATIIRARWPDTPIVIGGQHATLFAEEILCGHHDVIDAVAVGEGEETILEVAERLRSGEDLTGIAGLMTRKGDEVRFLPRTVTTEMSSLPLVSYEDVVPAGPPSQPTGLLAALDTSRGGCAHDCAYCLEACSVSSFGRSAPQHSDVERLVDQIRLFVDEGRDCITIQDQFFTHGDELLCSLIEMLHRRGIRLRHLSVFVSPGCYGEHVYDVLAGAPVDELVVAYGIETGSAKVAKNLGRYSEYEGIMDELGSVAEKTIQATSWWMTGLPGESREDIGLTKMMLRETMKLGVTPQSVSPLVLFPQTRLSRQREEFGIRPLLSSFEDFKRFSTTPNNQHGLYPELVTHESEVQSAEQTIRYTAEVKGCVMRNLSLLEGTAGGDPGFYWRHSFF